MLRFLNINTRNNIKTMKQENSIKVHLTLEINKWWVHYQSTVESDIGSWQRSRMEYYTEKIQSLGRPYHFNFLKDCLPQILFVSLLNTLTQICFSIDSTKYFFFDYWILNLFFYLAFPKVLDHFHAKC